MAKQIKNAKTVQAKSRAHTVRHMGGGSYEVTSGETGNTYRVFYKEGEHSVCTCDWGKYRPNTKCGCSHVVATAAFVAQQAMPKAKVYAWGNLDAAKRQKKRILNLGDGLYLTVANR